MEVDTNVEVLYDFEYSPKDGQKVVIKEGEKLLLLKKTNKDWWQVIRSIGRPFYVPSTYVKVLGEKDGAVKKRNNISSASPPRNFTVSVNIKSPDQKPIKTKVMLNCDEIPTDRVSERYGRIPFSSSSELSKKKDTLAEANILDDNMSPSLADLAKEITFKPKQDRLKYSGSFKTRYERKMPSRSFSGSTPDLTCDSEPSPPDINHTKSVEQLPDLENNVVPTNRHISNNIRSLAEKLERNMAKSFNSSYENNNLKDSSDSVGSSIGGHASVDTLGASSSESIDKPKIPPVAKPRRFQPVAQNEVIYANCLEVAREMQLRSPCRRNSEKDDSSEEMPTMTSPPIPPTGWSTYVDTETQQTSYIHSSTGEKWHSASDHSGRLYYFKENSSESSWTLPNQSPQSSYHQNQEVQPPVSPQPLPSDLAKFNKISQSQVDVIARKQRTAKALSLIVPSKIDEKEFTNQKNKSRLPEGLISVISEGPLHFTKIAEAGKRVRKNWNPVYVVLTELYLFIYKDLKAFHSHKTPPEVTIDLQGVEVCSGGSVSGRKHVLLLSNQSGFQIALQCENIHSVLHWGTKIQETAKVIPEKISNKLGSINENPVEEPSKKGSNIGRSKSVNFKNKDDSTEDLGSQAERQGKIKERLKKFFHKRPTMDSLVKKGIWKDEPVFGCYLEQACGHSNTGPHGKVPLFVVKCIAAIESSEENMKAVGLYRASGNLSQIQKIRLQIDQNNYTGLAKEEDVHVLTGALKLFFRELKEPLIPFKLFPKVIQAGTTQNTKEKLSMFVDFAKSLPAVNRDTLKFLLQHLLRVTQYQEFNMMHIANLATVFGPTLLWSEQESLNMAFDLIQQNMVIDALLNNYHHIFK
ncbi:rho GTPase-activating protein 9-like isoform X2 [Cimex lectularius]|uniref:Uncharacterized protein n=1 Tax=Cimex lectularius TaxID=79782 RepID=A0A8I6R9D7_CIMLE|nr:rho GTPase-activating protein 9-like isoform X2 [Cimex lectularius]